LDSSSEILAHRSCQLALRDGHDNWQSLHGTEAQAEQLQSSTLTPIVNCSIVTPPNLNRPTAPAHLDIWAAQMVRPQQIAKATRRIKRYILTLTSPSFLQTRATVRATIWPHTHDTAKPRPNWRCMQVAELHMQQTCMHAEPNSEATSTAVPL
jgi:hypothetical protein